MKSCDDPARTSACQTLYRGLDIISAVSNNIVMLQDICDYINVSYSTTYRLATALVNEGYLNFEARKGYSLGSKLIQLGFLAYSRLDLPAIARPYLEQLALETNDTVHLAKREGLNVFYLDKVAGQRAVQISSNIGGYKSICDTGVGKALLMNQNKEKWIEIYKSCLNSSKVSHHYSKHEWVKLMQKYTDKGYTFDLGEDVKEIRCVAAPIKNANNDIIAAISVSSAVQYMDEARMCDLVPKVKNTALQISKMLGYLGE